MTEDCATDDTDTVALEHPSSVKTGDATTAASAKFKLPAGQLLRSQTPTAAFVRRLAVMVVGVHVVAVTFVICGAPVEIRELRLAAIISAGDGTRQYA